MSEPPVATTQGWSETQKRNLKGSSLKTKNVQK